MPLEEILQRIKKETEEQIKEIQRQAKKEEEKILSPVEEEARRRKETIVQRAKLEASRLKDRMISSARLELQKSILREKQTILEEVFQQAIDRLLKLDSQDYFRVIEKLLLQVVETGKEEIIFSPPDQPRLDSGFLSRINQQLEKRGKKGELKLSGETRPLMGGFILRSGKVEINCSFSALVLQQRELREKEIVNTLFGS